MICVLPFCEVDEHEVRQWLSWVNRLGGVKRHHLLFVADDAVKFDIALEFMQSARQAFASVEIVTNGRHVAGWPQGPNSLFLACLKHMRSSTGKLPWFWCEPDCIPLKANWLDALESEYVNCGKPYMGAFIANQHPSPELPDLHVAGCAVYPWDAHDILGAFCNGSKAWDMAAASKMIVVSAPTKLIQNFWGQQNLPPTFALAKVPGSPVNLFTMANVNPDAVVFHRNKDGTLIRLLWRTMFADTATANGEFIVVIPFHNGDAPLAIKNLKWQRTMHQQPRYDCLLAYDVSTIKQFVAEMQALAAPVYRRVDSYQYPKPPQPKWPQAANWAFQAVARYMQHVAKRPWLWAEPDMIPLKPEWIDMLQSEYLSCGKPVMGSVVPGMGHMNGTGIYPANLAAISPKAMASKNGAFDTDMKSDIEGKVHDASSLMQHAWGIVGGRVHHNSGPCPSFRTPNDIEAWVAKDAVTFHRCKDGSLIKVLQEMLI